jgi:hypothetical protein
MQSRIDENNIKLLADELKLAYRWYFYRILFDKNVNDISYLYEYNISSQYGWYCIRKAFGRFIKRTYAKIKT